MALYFLEYDLRKERNYQVLYDELEKFNAVRVLESFWCFKRFDTTSSGLRDHFKQLVDADDGLCITEVTAWATYNTIKTPNDIK